METEQLDQSSVTTARRAVAGACAGAVAGAVPFGRLRGLARVVYSSIPGLLGAAWAVLPSERPRRSAASRVRLVLLVAGTGALGQNLGIVVDRAAEGWLRRRGVRHPRFVIAVAGALYGAVNFVKNPPGDKAGKA